LKRFHIVLGLPEAVGARIVRREAVRAVVFRDDTVLMVKTNKGDYKFPGGGVEGTESREDALKREINKETGYTVTRVKEETGDALQRHIDTFDDEAVFEMTSRYYICEVSFERTVQRLDEYEAALGFTPVWVTIDDAIAVNEALLAAHNTGINPWVYRETCVLKELRKRKG